MQLFVMADGEKREIFISATKRADLPTYDGSHLRIKNCRNLINKNDVFAEPDGTNFGYTIGSVLLFGLIGVLSGGKQMGALLGIIIGATWGLFNHTRDVMAAKKFNAS